MSPAKHLPLQKFEAINMPFHASIVPRERESGQHGGIIATNAIGKTLEFADLALCRTCEPVRQVLCFALLEQFQIWEPCDNKKGGPP